MTYCSDRGLSDAPVVPSGSALLVGKAARALFATIGTCTCIAKAAKFRFS